MDQGRTSNLGTGRYVEPFASVSAEALAMTGGDIFKAMARIKAADGDMDEDILAAYQKALAEATPWFAGFQEFAKELPEMIQKA